MLKIVLICYVSSALADTCKLQEDVDGLKHTTKILAENLEKWNNLFLNTLEPRMVSSATSLANIASNVQNLQERAHVWDTFQLHVLAWNDQLATLDRKADIISKGQEKLIALESKINSVAKTEYKIDEALGKMNGIQETLSNLKEETQGAHKCHDVLFSEFASRGILSTIKVMEKKLDRLLLAQQNSVVDERPKLTIKCNTPRFVEEFLKDIASKVDVIFDRISGREESENDYGVEDYLEVTTMTPQFSKKISKRSQPNLEIDNLFEKISEIANISLKILDLENISLQLIQQLDRSFKSENKCKAEELTTFTEPTKKGCEDLGTRYTSGVYIFGQTPKLNAKNRTSNKKYCIVRDDGIWTVLQKRDNYIQLQNFNLSWSDYKNGFGDLSKDFWFGNDFISELSRDNQLLLRIEMEDFEGRFVWAEYSKFVVLPEDHNYRIIVGRYRGNASDSFSSHNGSLFSTFDRKNDQAPECCPCAISYGGGWWFNSCFESNLNGIYYKKGHDNGYYGGIIWETWLGNYSLKKTLMMVKILAQGPQTTPWPYYEDP